MMPIVQRGQTIYGSGPNNGTERLRELNVSQGLSLETGFIIKR